MYTSLSMSIIKQCIPTRHAFMSSDVGLLVVMSGMIPRRTSSEDFQKKLAKAATLTGSMGKLVSSNPPPITIDTKNLTTAMESRVNKEIDTSVAMEGDLTALTLNFVALT